MPRHLTILGLLLLTHPGVLPAQQPDWLFPKRSLMPVLLAGPRDPVTSASLLGVVRNPHEHGRGVEAELSIGSTLPVFLLRGAEEEDPIVLGLEAVAFGRFGLQVLERELVATDWIFAVPLIWHDRKGWTRVRFYHASSHMGDEYSRRFGDPGTNFSRDAVEILTFRKPLPALGAWAGVRFGYNVKPEDDERWVLRAGAQLEGRADFQLLLPFLAADLELDQEAAFRPRVEVRVGGWLPEVRGRRAVRFSLVVLNGPTPLGQFRFRPTTQIGISLQGSL
jgi:hypothetical protein